MYGGRVAQRHTVQAARVELDKRAALSVEHVVVGLAGRRRPVGLAQLLGEHVPNVVTRRREAPRVVRRTADQHVHGETRDRDPLRVDAGPVEIHLLHDLGVVVAELRPHHGQRVAAKPIGSG